MEIEDHVRGVRALDCDLEGADAADRRGFLMDIAGHRDTCHQVVERSPQRRDVGSEVELALAQYGVQLQLLLFAHRLFSSLSTGCARAS